MGSILLKIPDLADHELIYNEHETRQILVFFWHGRAPDIADLEIENEARRLAQAALMAAIEGSYAMGFLDALGRTVARPGSGIKDLAKKLARNFARHWWQHTKRHDLDDVKIYESVRRSLSLHLKHRMDATQSGIALKRSMSPFFVARQRVELVWA